MNEQISSAIPRGKGLYTLLGTQGLGVGFAYPVSPRWDIRGGLSVFEYNTHRTRTLNLLGVDRIFSADINLQLQNIGLYADWYPIINNGFRITAGIQYGNNTAKSRPTRLNVQERKVVNLPEEAQTWIGVSKVETTGGISADVSGKVDFGNMAPYIGIGWQSSELKGWGMLFDAGLRFGRAEVAFESSNIETPCKSSVPSLGICGDSTYTYLREILSDRLNTERIKYEKDLKILKPWPVINVGLIYRW